MAQITYTNKQFVNQNSSVPAINKVQDSDMNEIKSVVNGLLSSTQTTDSTLGYNAPYINSVVKREIITGNLGSNTSYTNNAVINFPSANITSTTTKITYSSGSFTIGSGISKVLISANVVIQYNATNNKVYGFEIMKGTASQATARCQKTVSNPVSIASAPKLIDVSQGDVLKLQFSTDSSTTTLQGNSWFTIEIVE